jgi:HD superfamily phosphohydrolase
MVFACAEHSRFIHSLGVYELANRLLNNPSVVKLFSEREQVLLLASCLLHDLGHGAFSHAFESTFKVNHEKIGARIIQENPEIRQILDGVDSKFAVDVSQVILKESQYPLIEKLVSGQIDVDRLDYLRRDAYFTGVSYGYVDFERILRVLRIENGRIVFKESGIHAIENYLISRYHMYCQVYFHKTTRGYEIILEKIYQRIYELVREGFTLPGDTSLITQITNHPDDLITYLKIDDSYIHTLLVSLMDCQDVILKTLIGDLLHRKLWKAIDLNKISESELNKIKKNNALFWAIQGTSSFTYIDLEGGQTPIYILSEDGKVSPIEQVSPLINSLIMSGTKTDLVLFYREETPDLRR